MNEVGMRHIDGSDSGRLELLEHPLRHVQVVELERSLRIKANRRNPVERGDI
jgi:hypothetical protein